MSPLAFVADVHLGNHRRQGGPKISGINRRAQETLDVLEAAAFRATEDGTRLMVLGDLFDSMRPNPQIMAAAMAALPHDAIVLKGNHDSASDHPEDHALGPLAWPRGRQVISEPTILDVDGLEVWAVPFQSGHASEWLPDVLAGLESGDSAGRSCRPASPTGRILTLHLGVEDGTTPEFLKGAHDSIPAATLHQLQQKHKIGHVFTGNWHNHAKWDDEGNHITQVGALVPTGWDNPGRRYGGLAYSDGSMEFLPGPRFLKLTPEDPIPTDDGNLYYVRLLATRKHAKAAEVWAQEARDYNHIRAVEVLPEPKELSRKVAAAAAGAKSADTLNEAVHAYLGEAVEDEDQRAQVEAKVRYYLG